jgi:hypothetical protein
VGLRCNNKRQAKAGRQKLSVYGSVRVSADRSWNVGMTGNVEGVCNCICVQRTPLRGAIFCSAQLVIVSLS